EPRLAGHLAGKDEALHVAARERAGAEGERRQRDAEPGERGDKSRAAAGPVRGEAAAASVRPRVAERHVLEDRETGHRRHLGGIFGHEGYARRPRLRDRPAGGVITPEVRRTG